MKITEIKWINETYYLDSKGNEWRIDDDEMYCESKDRFLTEIYSTKEILDMEFQRC